MTEYFLGHSQLELQRLAVQAKILQPITERLLHEVRLKSGMRVLDLGCGLGDVSLLAAKFVGTTGSVVGIDQSATAIFSAQERAKIKGVQNVKFLIGTEADFHDEKLFDLVICRYVLIHQPDPVGFIIAAAKYIKLGGILAFHEVDLCGKFESWPKVAVFDEAGMQVMDVLRNRVLQPTAGRHLTRLFISSGLPEPMMFCERPTGRFAVTRWLATGLATILFLAHESTEEIDPDKLSSSLEAAVAGKDSQVLGPEQYCAWVNIR